MEPQTDRRIETRLDLQLSCRVDGTRVISEKSGTTTENISRNGLLLRWTRSTPAPAIGSRLRVEVELPSDGAFAPRLIRCNSTVVRVITDETGIQHVGLRVRSMRFVEDPIRVWLGDLNAATPVRERVN